jgi:very-long-chain (3R)-3-hydroxyacyl-CoA dehydratase
MLKHYLRAYSALSVLLWSGLFIWFWLIDTSWIWPLVIVQGLAFLDVFHSAFRFVKASVSMVLAQYLARMFISGLLFIANYQWPIADTQAVQIGTGLIFLAWPASEVIRHAYYLKIPHPFWHQKITFLRYSAFLVLYPLGVTAESLLMGQVGIFAYSAGGYTWMWIIVFAFVCYILFFPKLYLYLYRQRKKTLKNEQ